MNALAFIINHAEWTIPAALLVSFLTLRLYLAGRVLDEAERLLRARAVTPDRWQP